MIGSTILPSRMVGMASASMYPSAWRGASLGQQAHLSLYTGDFVTYTPQFWRSRVSNFTLESKVWLYLYRKCWPRVATGKSLRKEWSQSPTILSELLLEIKFRTSSTENIERNTKYNSSCSRYVPSGRIRCKSLSAVYFYHSRDTLSLLNERKQLCCLIEPSMIKTKSSVAHREFTRHRPSSEEQ